MRFLLVATLLAICGCATHVPMSESLMFSADSRFSKDAIGTRGNFGISFLNSVTDRQLLRERIDLLWGADDSTFTLINPYKRAIAWHNSNISSSGKFAHSLSIGLGALGLDATAQIADETYITVGVSGLVSFQSILQRRILDRRGVGVSVGMYHRYERYNLLVEYSERDDSGDPAGSSWIPFGEQFYINWVGLRSNVFVLVPSNEERPRDMFYQLAAGIGYSPELRSLGFYFSFSPSFGRKF